MNASQIIQVVYIVNYMQEKESQMVDKIEIKKI